MSSAPYGTWKSPILAEAITKNANNYEDVLVDAVTGLLYHLERLPSENGRTVLVATSTGTDVVPPPLPSLPMSTTAKQHSPTNSPVNPGTLGSPSPSPSSSNEDEEHVTHLMNSNDLEKERGITILSKCTSISYTPPDTPNTDNPYHITPGHADFGGEVDQGPMTQTRFVLSNALALGPRPLAVLNKADRPSAQVEGKREQVKSDLFDLFVKLGASDEQADYSIVNASAKEGWASLEPPTLCGPVNDNMKPLFETILSHVPPPTHLDVSAEAPFRMLTIQLESDPYVGTLYLGRVQSGQLTLNTPLVALNAAGEMARCLPIPSVAL
ncbi:P-loop containing nucleoside triphosphate hydrolase protein [Coprinopsis sp. MPI-PUGE-AT-0042]|nr:P-loop containing nucleoside triphosphate hydrolase protein [Coprinopsis sp. MPI-PUGE-AT-0042]